MPPRPETDVHGGRTHRIEGDDIQISDRARIFVATGPTRIPSPGKGGGNEDLLKAARQVNSFLDEHPRLAHSPFGKAAGLLVRGAVHVAKGEGSDILPPESKEQLLQAAGKAKEFLGSHPRVAESPFGQAVAKLGGEIVSHTPVDKGDPGPGLQDKVIHAARQANGYLEAHAKVAEMPLGQAVDKLINGVGEMGDGKTIDADIQQLAKRIGNFIHNHPRLAQSEFGQLVSNLARGIAALDTTLPSEIDLPVVGDIQRETDPAVVELRPVDLSDSLTGAEEALAA